MNKVRTIFSVKSFTARGLRGEKRIIQDNPVKPGFSALISARLRTILWFHKVAEKLCMDFI